jgi:FHA domain-containing protein
MLCRRLVCLLLLRGCRRADAAAGRWYNCEVCYKPVGFGRSGCRTLRIRQVVPEIRPWFAERARVQEMVHADPPTNIDPKGRTGWYVDDAIVRLRLWGTEYAHPLPESRVPLKLGSGPTCDVQLHDEAGRLSREHAMLVPEPAGWEIRDLGSTNGLWIEGSLATKCTLQAGVKIQLGGLTLVAESLKFIGLRSLVCRLVGWAPARQAGVDEALQNLRDSAIHRTPLILVGDDDLAPMAMRLHRLTLGPSAPFATYGGDDMNAAIEAAMHGTLCVRIRRRVDISPIADAVHAVEITARPRLVLCTSNPADAAAVSAKPGRLAVLAMPPLSTRTDEISRLVHETAESLVEEMGAPSNGFTMHDLERLQAIKFLGIADLEDSVRRVIAMRTWGVTVGAKKLGIKHSSLSQWARAKHRKLST